MLPVHKSNVLYLFLFIYILGLCGILHPDMRSVTQVTGPNWLELWRDGKEKSSSSQVRFRFVHLSSSPSDSLSFFSNGPMASSPHQWLFLFEFRHSQFVVVSFRFGYNRNMCMSSQNWNLRTPSPDGFSYCQSASLNSKILHIENLGYRKSLVSKPEILKIFVRKSDTENLGYRKSLIL